MMPTSTVRPSFVRSTMAITASSESTHVRCSDPPDKSISPAFSVTCSSLGLRRLYSVARRAVRMLFSTWTSANGAGCGAALLLRVMAVGIVAISCFREVEGHRRSRSRRRRHRAVARSARGLGDSPQREITEQSLVVHGEVAPSLLECSDYLVRSLFGCFPSLLRCDPGVLGSCARSLLARLSRFFGGVLGFASRIVGSYRCFFRGFCGRPRGLLGVCICPLGRCSSLLFGPFCRLARL